MNQQVHSFTPNPESNPMSIQYNSFQGVDRAKFYIIFD